MSYELDFHPKVLKEWKKLNSDTQNKFKKKLKQRLQQPHVASAKLSGIPNCYKIKLRSVGYRLIYRVIDDIVVVYVLAVGRRENDEVYENLSNRQVNIDELEDTEDDND
ncbi:type II toxin-antitoxin system RelE family toxin [Psychrobacter sp. I-STPA6b]|uniref:type II toxin-antitoxin system RelE family toxin n=1 Tax=Psychrobacter sp. I-STPA6b TaxID=2585718 RepID=UPI001D0C2954|nr:type II toxin-antitoxin system RelE/ParE family toxin [Psychrobacter sp. I-STPA6b]